MPASAPANPSASLALANLIVAMMVELQAMHRDLLALQDRISPLILDGVHVSGSARHRDAVRAQQPASANRGPPAALQDLDRLAQITAELSRLCEALAESLAVESGDCCAGTALRALTMKSLQDRLKGEASRRQGDRSGPDEVEIWA